MTYVHKTRVLTSGTSLYTVVKNMTGMPRTFGYLGEHGKRLLANEQYAHRGDLVSKLGAQLSRRRFDSLVDALDNGRLMIVSSPGLYLYDSAQDITRTLAVHNNILGVVDPSWASSGSSQFLAA